jgi:hypothetical protein
VALQGAVAGCGSHGRRSGDPEAGRVGSRGSHHKESEAQQSQRNQSAASRQPLRPPGP